MDADNEIPKGVRQEIADEQNKERALLKSDALLMQSLMAHPGWKRYLTMIEAVSQNYLQKALQPTENIFELVKPEHAKGTLNGLSLAAQLPAAKIREAKDQLGSTFMDAEK